MSAAGTSPSDPLLEPGAKVRVHSLQSAAHAGRNGTCGRLGEFIPESGRWSVQFEGERLPALALRPANLEFVAAAPPRRYGPGGAFEWPARVNPKDDLTGLSPSVFKDPRKFTPVPDSEGVVMRWGLEDSGGMESMMRHMTTQSMYGFGNDKTPEEQWIELRKQAKRQQIACNAAVSAASQDMEIRVELINGFEPSPVQGMPIPLSPRIWREFRLSGATNLGILHDKILSPVMGWTRNYHGYFYTDLSDGSIWAPIGRCDAIDMMHVNLHVIAALDPFETALYQILSEGGRAGGCSSDVACVGSRIPLGCLLARPDLIFFCSRAAVHSFLFSKVGSCCTRMTSVISSST